MEQTPPLVDEGRNAVKKALGWLVFLMVLAVGSAAAWVWYGIAEPYQGFPAEGVFVTVPRGASSRTAGRLLAQNGVVRSAFAFRLYAREHPRRMLQAGEYFFDHPISAHDVFWQIADGHVFQQAFTVREGETMFDIANDLEVAKLMTAEEFLTAAQNPEPIRDLAPHAKTLEGYLFPATYFLPRHASAKDLTEEMVKKFREEWKKVVATENPTDPSPEALNRPTDSIVTMASLVERETPKPEERPLVAGAFENRLRYRIALQCDPTVIYALQEAGKYRGTLTGADLHYDSPYNTYMHPGLPPGPIGNPGEASLRAALNPAQTDYLYFVADTHGGHFFAATLAEHNRNVTRYRRLLAGLPADAPEALSEPEQTASAEADPPKPPAKAAPKGKTKAGPATAKKRHAQQQSLVKKSSTKHVVKQSSSKHVVKTSPNKSTTKKSSSKNGTKKSSNQKKNRSTEQKATAQ